MMSEALFALLGVLIGSLTTIAVEIARSRSEERRRRTDALREASARYTSCLAQMELLSAALEDPERRQAALHQLSALQPQARAAYETLRLLLDSSTAQKAARMVLRHLWAVWKLRETGTDPRAGEFAEEPLARYHRELRGLLVGVRCELGLKHPADVFMEPID